MNVPIVFTWVFLVGQILICFAQKWIIPKSIHNRDFFRVLGSILSWFILLHWVYIRIILADWRVVAWDPLWLLASLVLPLLLYVLSMWVVGTQMCRDYLFPFKSFRLSGKLKKWFVRESLFNIYSCFYEELLYRWLIQNAIYMLSGSAVVAIVVSSAIFFLVHLDGQIAIVQMADILLFSIAITLFFQWTFNPLYCFFIHLIRNQLIICQKYVQKNIEQQKAMRYLQLLKSRK